MIQAEPEVSGAIKFDPMPVVENLSLLESRIRYVFKWLLTDLDFPKKYDFTIREVFGGSLFYVHTSQSSLFSYMIEAFSAVYDQPTAMVKKVEELIYHWMFEEVIERYTKSRKKPNPALMETRAAEFCYIVTIKIEAIPIDSAKRPINFVLLREFQILQHIWESYRIELLANKCSTDQLIGFPMPFEFRNIDGTDFDLPIGHNWEFDYYSPSGKLQPMQRVTFTNFTSNAEPQSIKSTLSYMSIEKVGPNLNYLMDLMATQGKFFSVSSALKVYDQIICRLIIMHKYFVIHGDINPSALCFGTGEAVNVLYINNFEAAVVGPSTVQPVPRFHDRFVSHARAKEKSVHFIHDLEAAFYVFVYLLVGRLPWDSRLTLKNETDSTVVPADVNMVKEIHANKSITIEDKEKFWQSSSQFQFMVRSIEMEIKDTMYKNYTSDIMESIYSKVKESLTTCQIISQSVYAQDVLKQGSPSYNAYFSVRKIITSYFRLETPSNALKDAVWTAKTEILLKEDSNDRRLAWDLSFWCWNNLDTSLLPQQVVSVGSTSLKPTISRR